MQFLDQSLGVASATLVKQDKVKLQTSATAEVVSLCHFANECLIPVALDANQHNRKVTGNPVRPESCSVQEVIFPESSRPAARPDLEMQYFQSAG